MAGIMWQDCIIELVDSICRDSTSLVPSYCNSRDVTSIYSLNSLKLPGLSPHLNSDYQVDAQIFTTIPAMRTRFSKQLFVVSSTIEVKWKSCEQKSSIIMQSSYIRAIEQLLLKCDCDISMHGFTVVMWQHSEI